MGDDRPARYVEGDRVVYRASSLGGCTRSFLAGAAGMEARPYPAWFQEVLDEGTKFESAISAAFAEQTGRITVQDQATVELVVGEVDGHEVVVRGHIDGCEEGSPGVLREFKKIRESGWSEFMRRGVEVLPNYPWQVSVYMLAGGFDECQFVGGKLVTPDVGEPYIADTYLHHLLAPPLPRKAIVKRVLGIEAQIQGGLVAQDVDCDIRMWPCPFFYLPGHDPGDGDVLRTHGRIEGSDELYTVMAEYGEVTATIRGVRAVLNVHETRQKEARTKVIAMLRAAGHEPGGEIEIGDTGLTVHWSETTVAESVRKAYTMTKLTVKDKVTTK